MRSSSAFAVDVGPSRGDEVSALLKESIQYSLDNREDALHAIQLARDLDPAFADRFAAMWVNEFTLDYGDCGRAAVQRLLAESHERGIVFHAVTLDFAD